MNTGTNTRKRLKDFTEHQPPPSTYMPRPSDFAIDKLRQLEYVELYYFTPDGLAEASKHNLSNAPDALTLAAHNGSIVLRPYLASNPSSKVIPDDALTWREMSIAKTNLLHQMARVGWETKYIRSLEKFYVRLETHEIRSEPDGEACLLQYQAEVRREWHDALQPDSTAVPFDIGSFNEERIARTMAGILNRKQATNILRFVPLFSPKNSSLTQPNA